MAKGHVKRVKNYVWSDSQWFFKSHLAARKHIVETESAGRAGKYFALKIYFLFS